MTRERQGTDDAKGAAPASDATPTCPTCGCAVHTPPRTQEVTCTVCGEKRWPYAVAVPEPYVCSRCRVVSPEKRAAARAAGKRSAESRRKARRR